MPSHAGVGMLLQAALALPRAALTCSARPHACVAHSRPRALCAARTALAGRCSASALLLRPHVKCVRRRGVPGLRSPHASAVALNTSSEPAGEAPAPESALAMLKYYAAFLVFGCAVNTIGPMLPSLAHHIGLTPLQMAPLLTAKGFGGLAGSFLCPLIPMAYLMPFGLLSISISFATIPVVQNLFQMALVYSFAAAVYQAVSIAAHTLIAQQHGERAGPHLNGINALFGAGSLLAPAVHRTLSPLLTKWSPLASYWAISCAALLVTVPFLAGIRGIGASRGHHAHDVPKPDGAARAVPPLTWTGHQLMLVVAAMALVACNVGAENCFGTWLYTYALQVPGLGPAAAANAVSLFWGSFTAGRLLAIPASVRLAPAAILLGSLPLAVLAPCIMLLARGSSAALFAASVMAGLGISTGFANSVSLLSRYVLPDGKVQSLIQLAATAGSMTFPPGVALIAQTGVLGVEAFLWVAALCAAVDIVLVVVVQSLGERITKSSASTAHARGA